MPQPSTPSSLPPFAPKDTAAAAPATGAATKRKLPGPEEVLAHYESQGLDAREASLKAIGELQALLYKSLAASPSSSPPGHRKLDNVNTRLAILEMKLDTKPGFPETLAIGVASGTLLRGLDTTLPHVFRGLSGIWDAVRAATGASHPSS